MKEAEKRGDVKTQNSMILEYFSRESRFKSWVLPSSVRFYLITNIVGHHLNEILSMFTSLKNKIICGRTALNMVLKL